MFTIEQIQEAHQKVKSGADFPTYIKALKAMGVETYTSYVKDGHTIFVNSLGHSVTTPAKYPRLSVNGEINIERFLADLKKHQEGQTDYLTFCSDCADSGMDRWVVDLINGTCIYYDAEDHVVLVEQIPE